MGSEFVMGARFELEDEFSQPMSEMSRASQEFQQSLDSSSGVISKLNDGFISAGKTMQSWGKKASKSVTTPLVGIGTAAVWTTATFDDSMSKVSALSGATGDDFDALRGKALELGSTTAHSASAAADAMGYLALAGFDTNEILEATPAMLSLASAASMDLATSADIVSDTMSAFQMEATRAAEAADIFAKIQASSNTDVMMLGEAMKYAGAAANAAGMDLAQTSAVMGVLADSGIKGSMAGTTFTSMLSDMRKNAENGALSVGDMSIALYDAQGNMRDLGTIMADMEKATAGMSGATRDAAMANIFGEQAMKGANIMLATGADRYYELEEAAYGSAGAASEMAATMEDNIGGAMRSMKSAIEGFMISIGDELKEYVQMGAQFVGQLALAFTNLDPSIRRIIVILGVVAAAIGPVLAVLGKLSVIIGTVGVPVAAAVAAVGALIAIMVSMYSTSEKFKNFVNDTFKAIGDSILAFWNILRGVYQLITGNTTAGLVTLLGTGLDGSQVIGLVRFAAGVQDVIATIQRLGQIAAGVFQLFTGSTTAGLETLFGAGLDSSQVMGIVRVVAQIQDTFIQLGNIARTAFQNVVQGIATIWQATQPVREALLQNIVAAFFWLVETVPPLLQQIGQAITTVFTWAVENVLPVVEMLGQGIITAFLWLAEQVPPLLTTLGEFVTNIWARAYETAVPILQMLWRFITQGFQLLVDTLVPVVQMLWQVLTTVWATIQEHVIPLVLNIVEMIISFWQLLVTFLAPILMFIWGLIVDVWSMVLEFIVPFMQNLLDTIIGTWNRIWEATGPLLNSLVEGITGIFDSLRVFFETWWPLIYGIFTVAWGIIRGIISAVLPVITAIIQGGFQFIMAVISSIWSMISGIIQVAWSLISGLIQTGLRILSGDWAGAWDAMLGMLSGVWDGIVTFFGGLKDLFFESGKAIIDTLVDGIKAVAMAPYNAVKGIFDSVRNLLPFSDAKEGPLSSLTSSGESIITTIGDGIGNMKGYLGKKLEGALEAARRFLPFSDAKKGPFSDLTASGGSIISTLAEGLTKKEGILAAAMAGAFALMPAAPEAAVGMTFSAGDTPNFNVEAVPEFHSILNVATLFDNADAPEYSGSTAVTGKQDINPAGTTGSGSSYNSRSVTIEQLNVEVNAADGQDPEEIADEVIERLYEKVTEADEVLGNTDKGDLL